MIDIHILIAIIWIHFVADFVFQSNWMALNKSKELDALIWHCTVYSLAFLALGKLGLYMWPLIFFSHLIIDGISSRVTSWLHNKNKIHWFFVVIGLDQAIHLTTLILFYYVLNWRG